MSITYEKRLGQFEKGNLVTNPSFENGRILTEASGSTFALRGWDKVGQNVTWVEQASGPDAINEVNTGRYAVKIVRKKADEFDEAEGIISKFIPVIPGNYYFTYNIRLKDILNNKYRLGVQLYDAVVVKVLFFDQDKNPIEPGYINPVSGTLIDNSDKGYSFSNYWRIDDFPWGSVRARSYNYPFSEGDLPERTRYVRLFLGLKGTGTMWLDDVDYRFSKWNFTTLERFKPYFDKQLTLAERIIPTPKRFQKVSDVTYYDSRRPNLPLPVIVLPPNPAPAERTAAQILQKKIRAVLDKVTHAQKDKEIKIQVLENDLNFNDIFNAQLVFSIGKSEAYQKVQPDLPLQSIRNKQQGYIIQAQKVGNAHIVFLIGETSLANYYAATTAIQLFENDECVYHNATIVDYPDFLERSFAFSNWKNEKKLQTDLQALERMSLYKMNKVYFGYNRAKKNWYQMDALYLKGVKEAGKVCRQRGGMSLAVMVNPYSHFPFEASVDKLSDQTRNIWTHSSPESFRLLKEVYKTGLDAGADTVMLLSDDFVPHRGNNPQNYSLYTAEDTTRFINLQNAQAHIINNLKIWIDNHYPGIRIEFCPPWYTNEHIDRSEGQAERYFLELSAQIPRDVAIIWTGPTIRSLSVDMADLFRYRSLIGRWPMIWDNTLYARNLETKRYGGYTTYYPDKVRMCNLFEPYDTYRPNEFQDYNHGRRMYTNLNVHSEVNRLKYATVADYEWNTDAYNPELALWKVLCSKYGPAGAKALLHYNDAYYGVYEMCLRMEIEGVNDEYIKKGKVYLAHLDNSLRSISKTLHPQKRLLGELVKLRDRQKRRIEKLSRGSSITNYD
ncbi:MAG: beta-N-acetylglucosaminidase domain-containing protein [Deltaproteobacteria bacterium]|nr:beta-N-acetylglucosaminidase domain-containing protein [Deltaproteobacteria bacterium]